MIIDCTECEMYRSEQCRDCVVTAVLHRDRDAPLEIDDSHEQAIARLQQAGLAPVLRFTRKAG